MSTKCMTCLMGMGFILAAAAISGCAAKRVSLVDNGTVSVERVRPESRHLSSIDVYQDGDEMVVASIVKRRHPLCLVARGHVDVTVLGPDGAVLKQAGTSHISQEVGTRIRTKRRFTSLFETRIPMTAPKGSTVRVAYNITPHTTD